MHCLNRSRRLPWLAASATLLAATCGPVYAVDWTRFRGPNGQGQAGPVPVPVKWSESENVAWKTPLPGLAWSSPVVWGKQAWMTTALNEGHSLRALCVDLDTGKLVHDIEVFAPKEPCPINPKNTYASPTPVIEAGRVYVHFGTMGTACLATETGEILWRNQDLKVDHKEGPGGSPILYKDLLILHCDGMDVQYVIALDKKTGKTVWKTDRTGERHPQPDQRKAYSTPTVIEVNGEEQLLSTAAHQILAYAPATGKELWKIRYNGFSNVSIPNFVDGILYVGTGYVKAEIWAMKPGGRGDLTSSNVLWKYTGQAPNNPSPVVVGKELYFPSDRGVGVCLDLATGKIVWRERLGGDFSASPLVINGHIYMFSEDGRTHVIEPGTKFKRVALNRIEGRVMATPAVTDRALLLRSDTHLYKIEDRGAAGVTRR